MKLAYLCIFILLLSCKSDLPLKFPNRGYNFAEKINSIDSTFPFYPIRNLETIYDSSYDALFTNKLFEVFKEKNISLRPERIPLLRIIFKEFTSPIYFITIDENKIIIKHGLRVDYLQSLQENLSEIENLHLSIFEMGVPLTKRIKNARPSEKSFLDSITKIYPELLTEKYYRNLMEKVFKPLDKPFEFSTKTIQFKKSRFQKILRKLEQSNFWNLPITLECKNRPSDGYSFTMEFNGGKNYMITNFGSCMDIETEFKAVCKEIIKIAELNNEIRL